MLVMMSLLWMLLSNSSALFSSILYLVAAGMAGSDEEIKIQRAIAVITAGLMALTGLLLYAMRKRYFLRHRRVAGPGVAMAHRTD